MSETSRHIVAITGSRAEYGLARPILEAVHRDPHLELQLIVTGMHLLPKFGYSFSEIQKDGFSIAAKVLVKVSRGTGGTNACALGQQVVAFTRVLERTRPSIVLVLTDLGHTLAGAIAALHLNVPVAHLHGGDVSGTIDESFRHATTKLAHLHFAATRQSAERIQRMGEEPWRIHCVGAPGLDDIFARRYTPPAEITHRFHVDPAKPLLLLIQHPVVQEAGNAPRQIHTTLQALRKFEHTTIAFYPNSDLGHDGMIQGLRKARHALPFLRIHKNLPREDYLGLMNVASVLIGNSSSGIIEAPSFGLPVINIGTRQAGRERTSNVIDVPYETVPIVRAIQRALRDKPWLQKLKTERRHSPYGQGKAGQTIARILRDIPIGERLLTKRMTY